MARPSFPELTPTQVTGLKDALLSNADGLLSAALAVLRLGNVALARSLAILGLEESGKAIAIHQRQVSIAYEEEGTQFVDGYLRKLWGSHGHKLSLVHEFLVDEEYWFDTQPSDPVANLAYLGAIKEWADNHNLLKQRGFYVDMDPAGNVLTPETADDTQALEDVIEHVHQIGWQLRLGEHIEAKRQARWETDIPPATEDEIEEMRAALGDSGDAEPFDDVLDSMREGTVGTKLNNSAYRLHLPAPGTSPFANIGKPGYEAETRALIQLAGETHSTEQPHDEGKA